MIFQLLIVQSFPNDAIEALQSRCRPSRKRGSSDGSSFLVDRASCVPSYGQMYERSDVIPAVRSGDGLA